MVIETVALAREIEGITRIDAKSFAFRGMLDEVFTSKLKLWAIVPVETDPSAGKRHPEVIGFIIPELLKDPDGWI